MSLADQKGTQRGSLDAYISFLRVCGEVIRLLLKYCIYCASAPSLHRESTDSLIVISRHYISPLQATEFTKSIDIAELRIPFDGVLVIWECNWMASDTSTSSSPSEVEILPSDAEEDKSASFDHCPPHSYLQGHWVCVQESKDMMHPFYLLLNQPIQLIQGPKCLCVRLTE